MDRLSRTESLRIVHVVCSDGFAGVERYIADVSAGLRNLGHDVSIIGGPARIADAVGDARVPSHPARRVTDVAFELARHACDADVIHVHMTAAETAALLARFRSHAPLVATRHFAARRGSSLFGRLVAPVIRKSITTEIAISQFVAGSIREPCEVVLNGVHDAPAVDPSAPVVLVAQRLEREKCTHDALGAWARSGLAARGWQLWIAGEGSERDALAAAADRLGDGSVRFLGYRDDLDTLRARAGIFLATASAEPFGLSVAEAMAAGLPVVAAGAGGHLETVGAARRDLLYAPGDVEACALLLDRLGNDEMLRRTVGTDLRSFQQTTLRLDRHVSRLVEIYARLCGTDGRARKAP